MTEERAPSDVGQEPAPAGDHEHLFRIGFGGKITIRYCERCGKSWALSQLREIIHNRTVSCWTEILEYDKARDELFK